MIESRYKIEYILPEEDVKKTSSFRIIWFLFLIPVVLLLVTAITYDFSIKDISRDSSVLLEKIKTQVFNLDSEPQLINKSAQSKTIVNISNTPAPSQNNINKDKVMISELTKKQELQLKEIQKQIAANKKQTQNLNKLSKELVLEQTKNQKLNSQLTAQEEDRLELEEQLNRIEEESALTKAQLESLNAIEKKRQIALQNSSIKEKASVNTPVEVTDQKEAKQSVIQSETDQIIETMVSITPSTDQSNKTDGAIEATIENKEISSEEQQIENEEASNEKTVSNTQINETPTPTPTPTPINILTTATEEVNQTIAAENDESKDTKEISNTNSLIEQKPSTNTQTNEKKSDIDNIIATMQENKANSSNNENNDIELEKEKRQELAEKDKE